MNPDQIFKSLSDPTRRALFDRQCREGQLSVHVLTEGAGVSLPAVSKHLAQVRAAGLVIADPQGRETFYRGRTERPGPVGRLADRLGRVLVRAAGSVGRPFETD